MGIPFSFLVALLIFPTLGITINLLSLVGFVMVSGMLVSDAIIVIENIYQYIEAGESVVDATIKGAEEVMWPVISAVCTTIAAFVPMLLVTGTSGQFMSILPKTVIACLAASLIECLLVLPAHYIDWGSRSKAGDAQAKAESTKGLRAWSHLLRSRTDSTIDSLRNAYVRGLERVLAHRGAFLLTCLGAFIFAQGLSTRVPVDLFPSDFNQLFVSIETPVDFSIEESNKVILGLEAALEPLAHEFLSVSTYVGQGMSAEERPVFGSNYGVFYVSFKDSQENIADPGRMVRLVRESPWRISRREPLWDPETDRSPAAQRPTHRETGGRAGSLGRLRPRQADRLEYEDRVGQHARSLQYRGQYAPGTPRTPGGPG